ncbi:MAG: acyl--CoA ligase [Proteobacteria bacterium]|nr:acyl--CoA ligase [Pseudomonadota bacterium]
MANALQITDDMIDRMVSEVTKPDAPYEVTRETIRGVDYRVFANAFENLKEMYASSLEKDNFISRKIAEWYGDEDGSFLVYEDERYSFAEAYRIAAGFSYRLRDRFGIDKGDRVVIAMRNYPEFCLVFMAITAIGAVAVPLNAWWQGPELAYGIRDSEPKLILADHQRMERLLPHIEDAGIPMAVARPNQPLPADVLDLADFLFQENSSEFPSAKVEPDDDAFIMYTSGSTGHPKGVVITHRAVVNTVMSWQMGAIGMMHVFPDLMEEVRSPYRSSVLLSVPLFHVTGCIASFLASFYTKRKTVMMYKWNPEEALRLIEKERITQFNGVPVMSWELVNSPDFEKYDTSSLGVLGGGGAERPPEHVAVMEKRMERHIAQAGYGLTETTALGATIAGEQYLKRPTSVGRPTPPLMEAKIVDVMGHDLPIGGMGEICFKSCVNFRGYWKKEKETADAFLEGGWFRTGDVGTIDEEGYIFIKDRIKDIAIRGGENISCREVEFAAYGHPAVFEAAVFGVPDEKMGEKLGMVIMVKSGSSLNEEELKNHLSQNLARFKVPEHIWLQNEPLPRMGTGKIFKRKIKQDKIELLEKGVE